PRVRRKPAVQHAAARAADACCVGQAGRALRTQRVHPRVDLADRFIRPMGRRARQGAGAAHRSRAHEPGGAEACPRQLHQRADPTLPRAEKGRIGGLLVQLGLIGLGRMGANMARRLLRGGHQCVVYDMSANAVQQLVKDKAVGSSSLAELTKSLAKPRAVWLMVPAGVVDKTVADLVPHLERGDILIDGGNSYYIDDIRRAKELAARGIHYVDVGTSGGVWGL